MRFGKIKFFAHRASTVTHSAKEPEGWSWKMFEPIPLFRRPIDRAISAHEERIRRAKTRRRKDGPKKEEWS